jgi:hypothetical protein
MPSTPVARFQDVATPEPAGPCSPHRLVAAFAVLGAAGLATAALLQAVDGVALKATVDLWSGAGEDRSSLFAAALAVRQVEIGLAPCSPCCSPRPSSRWGSACSPSPQAAGSSAR